MSKNKYWMNILLLSSIFSMSGCNLEDVKDYGAFCPPKGHDVDLSYIITIDKDSNIQKFKVSDKKYAEFFNIKRCPDEAKICAMSVKNGDFYCTSPCAKGQVTCNGKCIDPQVSNDYCGAYSEKSSDNEGTDGTIYETCVGFTKCSENETCRKGICIEDTTCLPGEIVCRDAVVLKCNSDSKYDVFQECESGMCDISGKKCADSTKPVTGTEACSEGYQYIFNGEKGKWVKGDICPFGVCNDDGTKCGEGCDQAGLLECKDNAYFECDGTAWKLKQQCTQNEQCNKDTGCVNVTDEDYCSEGLCRVNEDGNTLYRGCAGNKYKSEVMCSKEQKCDSNKGCVACNNGDTTCEGNIYKECVNNIWATTECARKVCSPTKGCIECESMPPTCENEIYQKCEDNVMTTIDCASSGQKCDPNSGCYDCEKMDTRCLHNVFQTCGADNMWMVSEDCGEYECSNAGCVRDPICTKEHVYINPVGSGITEYTSCPHQGKLCDASQGGCIDASFTCTADHTIMRITSGNKQYDFDCLNNLFLTDNQITNYNLTKETRAQVVCNPALGCATHYCMDNETAVVSTIDPDGAANGNYEFYTTDDREQTMSTQASQSEYDSFVHAINGEVNTYYYTYIGVCLDAKPLTRTQINEGTYFQKCDPSTFGIQCDDDNLDVQFTCSEDNELIGKGCDIEGSCLVGKGCGICVSANYQPKCDYYGDYEYLCINDMVVKSRCVLEGSCMEDYGCDYCEDSDENTCSDDGKSEIVCVNHKFQVNECPKNKPCEFEACGDGDDDW